MHHTWVVWVMVWEGAWLLRIKLFRQQNVELVLERGSMFLIVWFGRKVVLRALNRETEWLI